MDKEALTTHLISLYLRSASGGFLVLSYGLIPDVFAIPTRRGDISRGLSRRRSGNRIDHEIGDDRGNDFLLIDFEAAWNLIRVTAR